MSILEILKTYDHLSETTDKNTLHSYEKFYDEKFIKFKDKKINFCEIGINLGGSLFLWDKYFTNAEIFGIDIEDRILEKYRKEYSKNVSYKFCDAYDESCVNSLNNFDIIVDDGIHSLESQKFVVKHYLPKLNDGGILIIEDIQDYSWFNELVEETPEEYRNNIECIDLRKNKGRFDDMIFVIKK